jgi:hypothetical protein
MEQPMLSLSPEKILAVWEAGRQQHELDRALTLLAAASPGRTREELAGLSIGERDARLLQLRTLVLGTSAHGFAECPQCAERVEFPVDTAALALVEGWAPALPNGFTATPHEIELDGTSIRFRLPDSRDLAEVVAAPDARQGLRRLVERCVIETSPPNEPSFSSEMVEALSHAMLEADPQAEISLVLACPSCGHGWQAFFDIADFFWNEIAAQARRLLREIDLIARAYGWTEREILDLPAQRRQTYLELIAA